MSWASRQNLLVRASHRILGAASVTWGSAHGSGRLRLATEIVLDGEIERVDAVLDNLPYSVFGAIKHGDTITVDGNTFRAECDPFRYGDGNYCRLPLSGPIGVVLPSFQRPPNSRQALLARAINRTFDAVPVVWGAIQGEGLLRLNSQLVIRGEEVIVDAVIENLPFSVFGELKYGDQLVIAGNTYIVEYGVIRFGDGVFCRVPLTGPITITPPPDISVPLTTVTGLGLVTTATGLGLVILPET